jgi:hypothetical protein
MHLVPILMLAEISGQALCGRGEAGNQRMIINSFTWRDQRPARGRATAEVGGRRRWLEIGQSERSCEVWDRREAEWRNKANANTTSRHTRMRKIDAIRTFQAAAVGLPSLCEVHIRPKSRGNNWIFFLLWGRGLQVHPRASPLHVWCGVCWANWRNVKWINLSLNLNLNVHFKSLRIWMIS